MVETTGRLFGIDKPHLLASFPLRPLRAEEYWIKQRIFSMISKPKGTIISVMLAVPDTPTAVEWYEQALGARLLWSLGSVAGMEVDGAPFILHEPVKDKFVSPLKMGATTVRVEMFVDNPDEVIARAVAAGAIGGEVQNHTCPWGLHRQGGFTDPFGHLWLVGDKSPLNRFAG